MLFSNASKQSSSILDVGCGIGEYLGKVAGWNETIVGLDLDCVSLKKRVSQFLSIQGDAQHLPFKATEFDLILFSEVLEHMPDPESALDEIVRVLKPDGRLIISTPCKSSFYEKQFGSASLVQFLVALIQKLLRRPRPPSQHISVQYIGELKRKISIRNLQISEEYYTGFCLPFSHELFNFLFNFKLMKNLYRKLDFRINKSYLFRNLNWIMIFVCRKKVVEAQYIFT
jgi:ubiquinone/menaquinone biosynthesis C-methylase UbiE